MSSTAAKIASLNKTENTGITPPLARKMYDSLGSKHIAIVEFKVATRTEGDDDSHEVKLDILAVEPAASEETDEHLRELQRALYRRRNPQPALTVDVAAEPTIDGVIDEGIVELHCGTCEHRWTDKDVAHSRGTDEGFPPCTWRACGHIVGHLDRECEREHDYELALV